MPSLFSKDEPENAYPASLDYEWYGCDEAGHVAVFTTAGKGPMPRDVIATRATADEIYLSVWQMPQRTTGKMLVSLPRADDYLFFASRGFFAYDWHDVHRAAAQRIHQYEPYSRPANPIHISELPSPFQVILQLITFRELRFADGRTIDVRKYFACEDDER